MTIAAIFIRQLRHFTFALFLSPLLLSTGTAQAASNMDQCATDPKAAVAAARAALQTEDTEGNRAALLCLIEAVAQLDERLSDTLAGRIEFEKITSKAYYPSANSATVGAK